MSPKTRDTIYIILFILNASLEAASQSNAFAGAPNVAHYVLMASAVTFAMLQRFRAPDPAPQAATEPKPEIGFKQ